MSKFIKLTEIECNGHEIISRTARFFNGDFFASLTPQAHVSGCWPKCTQISVYRYGTVFVEEDAGWIAQTLNHAQEG